jgi:hypothetical protein
MYICIYMFIIGIRGETVGVGMVIRRKLHLNGMIAAIKSLFLSPNLNNVSIQKNEASDVMINEVQRKCPDKDILESDNRFNNVLKSVKKLKKKIKNDDVKQFIQKNSCLHICHSYLNHLKVTCLTVTPFLIAATCQHIIHPNIKYRFLLNTWALRILSLSIGLIHVTKIISPFLLPLEVISLQPNGPSEISGIQIGENY